MTQPRNRKIVAIASGKGGVGKTWCAITLAKTLTDMNKRVLLIDGDLGLANIDIQLGLGNCLDYRDFLRDSKKNLADCVQQHDGINLIAGSSGSGALGTLSSASLDRLGQGIVSLTPYYDIIILDLGAGVDTAVRRLSALAGQIVVVTTPEPTALTDAYAYIKVTMPPKVALLVNMADDAVDGERAYNTLSKACYNFLKIKPELLGIIHRDKAVPAAIRRQKTIVAAAPRSGIVKEMRAVAVLLVKIL
jgi:flagellar biosynthesis protein FlhG